jgi:hypothetical protein
MKRHGVDLDTARKVIVNGMLSDQPAAAAGQAGRGPGFHVELSACHSLILRSALLRASRRMATVSLAAHPSRRPLRGLLRVRSEEDLSEVYSPSISVISASEIVSPSAFAFSRAFSLRMPGKPCAGLRLDRLRQEAEPRRRAAAERRRIERQDQLPGAGRRTSASR